MAFSLSRRCFIISIHALLAESDTKALFNPIQYISISIHALLAESDYLFLIWVARTLTYFYPRCTARPLARSSYFYPRSPCGERRYPAGRCTHPAGISIHALLAESDSRADRPRAGGQISIHALLAESDQGCGYCYLWALAFLSTLSLRRATAGQNVPFGCIFRYFYPRSPCGERQC